MNYRKYKSNPKELLEQGRAIARQKGNDAKFQHRVEIVNLVLSGHSPSELSKDMGCHINTIMRWVKAADEQGFESPQDGKHTGRPLRLSESQLQDIDNALQKDPSKHGYNVWDGLAISDFIQRTHGVFYAVRSCQRLAKRLGFSRVRPQVFPSKEHEDTEERSEFKKKLMDLMSDPNAVIVSQDEVHFQQQTTVTGKLVKRGSRPTVKSFPGKNKVSYSGFVVLGSGQLYVTKPERFNYVSTLDAISSFLDACPLKEGKTYYMILDNASWHKKAKRLIKEECLPEYDRIRDSVRFLDIPPYSPDLNPIEQVWRITRREKTHNRFFASIREEMKLLDEWFSEFSAPNEKLASLCTFHFHPMSTTLS